MGRRTFLHPLAHQIKQTPDMGSKWLRFFRVIHHLIKKSTPLKTGSTATVAAPGTPEGKARHTDPSRTSTR